LPNRYKFSSFDRKEDENCIRLGHYAESNDNSLTSFGKEKNYRFHLHAKYASMGRPL